uniref:Uncharacterized protein n=1 Tax=uncultured prokaryote TaxID=198431 RepID=A0A0H5Q657_9ZZZZ|nr:hypothetical protein [uncultured prokaryote]
MREYKGGMIRTTDKYLVVYFTEQRGTTYTSASVKVPLKGLVLSASVMDGLDRAMRRSLVEHWSGLPIPDEPLF